MNDMARRRPMLVGVGLALASAGAFGVTIPAWGYGPGLVSARLPQRRCCTQRPARGRRERRRAIR